MKLDLVANSKNDEFYTPYYAIEPILKYLKNNSVIWCPFDTEKSLFVNNLVKEGHKVYYSHISMGDEFDFFSCEIPKCDYIISNPPYSVKTEVFQRLFEIGKPFAMLVGVVGLFESKKRFDMFSSNEFELMYFDKRISYFKSYEDEIPSLNPPFSSVYVCKDILPKKIVFETLNKKERLK